MKTCMTSAPAAERRASFRHLAKHNRVACRSLADAAGPTCSGTVRDISADGIGLVLERWVPPGSSLVLTLVDDNGDAGIVNLVRVKHVLFQGRKRWSVGGALAQKIGVEQLQTLP